MTAGTRDLAQFGSLARARTAVGVTNNGAGKIVRSGLSPVQAAFEAAARALTPLEHAAQAEPFSQDDRTLRSLGIAREILAEALAETDNAIRIMERRKAKKEDARARRCGRGRNTDL